MEILAVLYKITGNTSVMARIIFRKILYHFHRIICMAEKRQLLAFIRERMML